jgi:hypothetical protein
MLACNFSTFNLSKLLVTLLIAIPCVSQADIFVSTNLNGLQKWSTQAVDATYVKTSIVENHSIQQLKPLAVKIGSAQTTPGNRKIPEATLLLLIREIKQVSNKHGIDPELVEALIAIESGFNTHAVSPKGARGLMQLMPATAKHYGLKDEQDLHIPSKNIDMGVRHLKDLLKLHDGQVALAIASYNAGQGAVNKHGQRIPAYRETMLYVPAVLSYMARYSSDAQSASNLASIAN